jgi:hypothetical protein
MGHYCRLPCVATPGENDIPWAWMKGGPDGGQRGTGAYTDLYFFGHGFNYTGEVR